MRAVLDHLTQQSLLAWNTERPVASLVSMC
jgi:hypothetical protein